MSQPAVELRRPKAVRMGKRARVRDCPQLQIIVEGEFVGYADPYPGVINFVVDDVPVEWKVAASSAVQEHWGGETPSRVNHVPELNDSQEGGEND